MAQGFLALVLHAHLPFVRHPEYEEFLEEDWLYEAITETYIPLVNMMDGLLNDGTDFRLTMSITPPLAAMLSDQLLQDRYVRLVDKLIELAYKEINRTQGDHQFHELAWFYLRRLENCRHVFVDKYHRNLLTAFKKFQDAGKLEIITCGATHGYLPLMQEYPQAVRAQIMIARDHYWECFGRAPRGIWLPECAYYPGVEKFLQEAEIRWFVVDTHAIMHAEPRPRYGVYAPLFTRSGPAAFGRDIESSVQVWSSQQGYPGDRRIAISTATSATTSTTSTSSPTSRPTACASSPASSTTASPARAAGRNRTARRSRTSVRPITPATSSTIAASRSSTCTASFGGMNPIVLAPYDAELYGHWWYEGPEFLNYVFRKTHHDQGIFKTITPGEYLERFPTQQLAYMGGSSWGAEGYYKVWLDEPNAWIYPHLHVAAGRMIELANTYRNCYGLYDRAMKQAARELLLAQSSDWAFIMKTGTMVPYAVKRTQDHIMRFTRLYEQIKSNTIDTDFLGNCEWRDNIFPNINWRYYI